MVVLIRKTPPLLSVAQTVVGHERCTHNASRTGAQVAVFGAIVHTTLAHDGGVKSRIVIGCDVPVPRQRQLHTADVVDVQGGWQHARFAFARQRKRQVRRGENGDALKLQHRATGRAHFFHVIQLNAVAAQHPSRQPTLAWRSGAGGITSVVDERVVSVHKFHALRIAPRIVQPQGELGLQKQTGVVGRVDQQRVAGVSIAVAVDQHMALRLNFFGVLVKGEHIGLHHHIVATHGGIALDTQHRIGRSLNLLTANKHRRIGQSLVAEPRGQVPAALEGKIAILSPHRGCNTQTDHRHTNP